MESKFIPILYSSPMVRAILKDKKTKTRRTKGLEFFNNSPDKYRYDGNDCPDLHEPDDKNFHWFEFVGSDGRPMEEYRPVKCPYGQVGDILWVRETFIDISSYKDAPLFSDVEGNFLYKADNPFIGCHKWKPSIYMPKEACRLFLQIKSITVERLNDISESDAIAEGIKMTWISDNPKLCMFKNYIQDGRGSLSAKESFHSLWLSINGPTSWVKNPWVWVIEFEKIEKPENFI